MRQQRASSLDEEIAQMSVPELFELLKALSDEIELRFMAIQ